MNRFHWFGVALVTSASMMVAACATSETDHGSETHWLTACDSDAVCGTALQCVCGTCTLPCTAKSDCGPLGARAACAARVAVEAVCSSAVSHAASLCLAACSDETGCGAGSSCIAGVCKPRTTSPVDGGTDASPSRRAPLVGLATSGGAWSFVTLDPTTGAESTVAALADLWATSQLSSDFDSTTRRWYGLGQLIDRTNRLLVVDAVTGAEISEPTVPSDLMSLAVAGDGGAVGIEGHDFETVSATSGATSVLSEIPGVAGFSLGMTATDPAKTRFYQVVTGTGPSGTGLLTLDLHTGATLFNVNTDMQIFDLEVDGLGRVLTFVDVAGSSDLRFVDPATGVTQKITSFPAFALEFAASAVDRDAGIIYQEYAPVNNDEEWLLAIDIASGLAKSVPLERRLDGLEVCSTCP